MQRSYETAEQAQYQQSANQYTNQQHPQRAAMNSSNIVAIPHHPPLPRGVSGIFQSIEQPYSSARDTKMPQHPQQRHMASMGQYNGVQRPSPQMYANSASHMRGSTGYHPYAMGPYRRESAGSYMHDNGYRAGYGPPGRGFSSDIYQQSGPRRGRQPSVVSDNSSNSADKAGIERKYACDWEGCGQTFDRIEHLNRHTRRHTGEKPYCCLVSHCSKKFSRFDNMMQHVGTHTVQGAKTEIPNIKNLNAKCNGRGRARRTSYRCTQDSFEKFRRHVEGVLGSKLAHCCILPTDSPNFSNLTLRPLLVETDAQSSEASDSQPLSERMSLDSLYPQKQRPRCDSVMGGADKHAVAQPHAALATESAPSTASAADSKQKMQACFSKFRVFPNASQARSSGHPAYQNLMQHRMSYPQSAPIVEADRTLVGHRHSLDSYSPPQISNLRNQQNL
ncbi:hypothetical protein IWW36_001376 [Coemansia brasiliensis]|uniref:C2H2-type domain-containing protein n=1 Tax=Coemansia brasiliensis TaxID=2650707 RepID=A0A9W8IE17_9FUNG|nr:hypothetical protein IWW36_001376 [Coemansia brasiliensis]